MRQTAIMTEASREIDLTIAHQLGLDGHHVVVFTIKPKENCVEHSRVFQEAGIGYWHVQDSLEKTGDRRNLVDETVAHYGHIDVLVDNAGMAPPVRADLLGVTEESYDQVMNINTEGTAFLTQLVVRQMLKQEMTGKKGGVIVNVGSRSAEVSSINRREHCISKNAVFTITTLLTGRLAGERVLVYEVRPGVTKIDITSKVQEKRDSLIGDGSFSVRRQGMLQDMADTISVSYSDKFSYTTGDHIGIDDGLYIKRL